MVACDTICSMILLESHWNLNGMAQMHHGPPRSGGYRQIATFKDTLKSFLESAVANRFTEIGRNKRSDSWFARETLYLR